MTTSQLQTNPTAPGPMGADRPPRQMGPTIDTAPNAYDRRWRALGALCVGLLLIALDTTVLNVALPTLARQLRASTSALQWIVDGYTVALGCLQLLLGGVGDRIGRRRMLLFGLALFAGASVLAAYAPSPNLLIGARALTGVGGAVILPCTLASVLALFPEPAERARALGVWSATLGIGVVIGPLTGGFLLDHYWFGSIFLLNVPIALVAIAATFTTLPETRGPRRRGRLDLLGAVLAVSGAGAILWGLIEAPNLGWSSTPVLGALLFGLLLAAGFVIWERSCPAPLFPTHVLASKRFRLGTAAITVLFFALYGFLFVLTQDLQLRLGYGAFAAGVRMLPAGGLLISAATAPAVVARLGSRSVLRLGLVTVGAGLVVVAVTSRAHSYAPIGLGLALVGVGMGLIMPTAEEAVLSSVDAGDAGAGAGANSTNLQLGGSLGVAVVGSIVITTYRHQLGHLVSLPPAALHAARPSLYAAAATTTHLPTPVQHHFFAVAAGGFALGLKVALLTAAAVCGAAAVLVGGFRPGAISSDQPMTGNPELDMDPIQPVSNLSQSDDWRAMTISS